MKRKATRLFQDPPSRALPYFKHRLDGERYQQSRLVDIGSREGQTLYSLGFLTSVARTRYLARRGAPLPHQSGSSPCSRLTVQRVGCLLPLGSGRSAELPRLCGRPLVVMNKVVEFELVDLPGVKLSETGPHVLEQRSQLRLVIGDHDVACGTTIRPLGCAMLGVPGLDHEARGYWATPPTIKDPRAAHRRKPGDSCHRHVLRSGVSGRGRQVARRPSSVVAEDQRPAAPEAPGDLLEERAVEDRTVVEADREVADREAELATPVTQESLAVSKGGSVRDRRAKPESTRCNGRDRPRVTDRTWRSLKVPIRTVHPSLGKQVDTRLAKPTPLTLSSCRTTGNDSGGVTKVTVLEARIGELCPWLRVTDHGSRITDHGSRITDHGSRITDHGSRITDHGSRITDHGSRITDHGSRITDHGSACLRRTAPSLWLDRGAFDRQPRPRR